MIQAVRSTPLAPGKSNEWKCCHTGADGEIGDFAALRTGRDGGRKGGRASESENVESLLDQSCSTDGDES